MHTPGPSTKGKEPVLKAQQESRPGFNKSVSLVRRFFDGLTSPEGYEPWSSISTLPSRFPLHCCFSDELAGSLDFIVLGMVSGSKD